MSDLVNEFAFSWSRHRAFYDCPRKLYWQYYGCWNGWREDASSQAALAYRLKQIKTLTVLVGETFHAELAEILRRRGERATVVPVSQLKTDMERRLLKRLRESRNADWDRFGDPKHYAILFEDYYQSGVSEKMESDAVASLHACVDGLGASPYGRRIFAVPKQRLRFVDPKYFEEKRINYEGILLYASPDLIVEDEHGGLHIIDWKTGKTFKANVAQLAVYGLFVQEKFGQPLERLTAHLIYVAAQQQETVSNLAEGVGEARRAILTYVQDVRGRLTDVEANVAGDISLFPMTENQALCRSCNFRELCGRMEEPAVVADGSSDGEDEL